MRQRRGRCQQAGRTRTRSRRSPGKFCALLLCEAAFCIHLGDGLIARARHALVCGNHYPLDAELTVHGRQRQNHLYGRAVRIGDNPVVGRKNISVNLRYHQFLGGIHSPERRVVNDAAADSSELRRELGGSAATCGEQCQLRTGGDGVGGRHNSPFATPERHLFADRLLRSHGQQFIYRKIPFFQQFQHSCTHEAGGPYDCDFHFKISFKMLPAAMRAPSPGPWMSSGSGCSVVRRMIAFSLPRMRKAGCERGTLCTAMLAL